MLCYSIMDKYETPKKIRKINNSTGKDTIASTPKSSNLPLSTRQLSSLPENTLRSMLIENSELTQNKLTGNKIAQILNSKINPNLPNKYFKLSLIGKKLLDLCKIRGIYEQKKGKCYGRRDWLKPEKFWKEWLDYYAQDLENYNLFEGINIDIDCDGNPSYVVGLRNNLKGIANLSEPSSQSHITFHPGRDERESYRTKKKANTCGSIHYRFLKLNNKGKLVNYIIDFDLYYNKTSGNLIIYYSKNSLDIISHLNPEELNRFHIFEALLYYLVNDLIDNDVFTICNYVDEKNKDLINTLKNLEIKRMHLPNIQTPTRQPSKFQGQSLEDVTKNLFKESPNNGNQSKLDDGFVTVTKGKKKRTAMRGGSLAMRKQSKRKQSNRKPKQSKRKPKQSKRKPKQSKHKRKQPKRKQSKQSKHKRKRKLK